MLGELTLCTGARPGPGSSVTAAVDGLAGAGGLGPSNLSPPTIRAMLLSCTWSRTHQNPYRALCIHVYNLKV